MKLWVLLGERRDAVDILGVFSSESKCGEALRESLRQERTGQEKGQGVRYMGHDYEEVELDVLR